MNDDVQEYAAWVNEMMEQEVNMNYSFDGFEDPDWVITCLRLITSDKSESSGETLRAAVNRLLHGIDTSVLELRALPQYDKEARYDAFEDFAEWEEYEEGELTDEEKRIILNND